MKEILALIYKISAEKLPATYGEYLRWLRDQGAEFYVNSFMMVVAGISERPGDFSNFTAKFMKPVSFEQIFKMREEADAYFAY